MQEKYYIDIDENRKILGRYLLSIHGENIPSTAQEVSEEVFNTSIQENHNYLNDDLKTCYKEYEKTQEEINEIRKQEIYTELDSVDTQTIRPLRAVLNGTGTDLDKTKLLELETKANTLRNELKNLV